MIRALGGMPMSSKNDFLDYRSAWLAHYGVEGMHWGVRRYQPYSVNPRKNGKGGRYLKDERRNVYSEALRREPVITKDITSSISKAGAKSYGLENRLKSEESIGRKLQSKDVNDAIRYTAILSDNNFVKEYNTIKSDLTDKGYTETRCKNYFEQYKAGKVNHKSVQCNYQTKDGYTFEIQFQTKASQKAKNKKVPLYEEARNPKTSNQRKSELIEQMNILADGVKDPPGINKIKEH